MADVDEFESVSHVEKDSVDGGLANKQAEDLEVEQKEGVDLMEAYSKPHSTNIL